MEREEFTSKIPSTEFGEAIISPLLTGDLAYPFHTWVMKLYTEHLNAWKARFFG